MRPVDATTLARELDRLAALVPTAQTWYLIGGCSMALQGLKPSTKDADAVLVPPTAWGHLVEKLESDKYSWTDRNEILLAHLSPEGQGTLQGWASLQGPVDWDFFPPDDIFDGLRWSPGFESRTLPYLHKANLEVRLANPDALFLLKAVTGRWRTNPGRDIDDMETMLARSPPDWVFIASEWNDQLKRSRRPGVLRSTAQDAVAELKRLGYAMPWQP